MGWEINLDRYKKYKDITPTQIRSIENQLYWEEHKDDETVLKWASNYDRFKEIHEMVEFPEDAFEFYKQFYHTTEFNYKSVSENVAWWGRNSIIYNWLEQNYTSDNRGYYFDKILDRQDIYNLTKYCIDFIQNNMPKEYDIKYAIKVNEDENDEDVILTPCKGIEIESSEEGNHEILRLYSDYDSVYYINEGYDYWDIVRLISAIKDCVNILYSTDWENEYIYVTVG